MGTSVSIIAEINTKPGAPSCVPQQGGGFVEALDANCSMFESFVTMNGNRFDQSFGPNH
jgi:hypothetical protein